MKPHHFSRSLARHTLLAVSALLTLSVGAAEPAVLVEGGSHFIVGAHAGGKWVKSEQAAKLARPGTRFRVFGLTGPAGQCTGGKAAPSADVCPEVLAMTMTPPLGSEQLAVAAPWNAQPRAPKRADVTQAVYREAVGEFLRQRGIREPKVKIAQLLRVDLDGDGEDEVLLSATNYFVKDQEEVLTDARAGSYSFVLLRRVVAGKVRTQLIDGEFYPKAKTFNAPNLYTVSGVLDLDGDGRMEVVVHSSYYEGGATTVWRCGESKVERVLEIECGA